MKACFRLIFEIYFTLRSLSRMVSKFFVGYASSSVTLFKSLKSTQNLQLPTGYPYYSIILLLLFYSTFTFDIIRTILLFGCLSYTRTLTNQKGFNAGSSGTLLLNPKTPCPMLNDDYSNMQLYFQLPSIHQIHSQIDAIVTFKVLHHLINIPDTIDQFTTRDVRFRLRLSQLLSITPTYCK